MQIRATYVFDFEADLEGIDPVFVDLEGYAKDLTKRELEYLLKNSEIVDEDFKYEVINI